MPKFLAKRILNHSYPSVYGRFPWLLRVQHFVSLMLTLRFWHVRNALRRMLREMPNNFSLLDVGTGTGELIFPFIRKYKNVKFLGIDPGASNIAVADGFVQWKSCKNVRFIKSRLDDLSSHEKFDLIVCISVLQYVTDEVDTIKRMVQHLKPGGKILVYVSLSDIRVIPGYLRLRNGFYKDVVYDTYQKLNPRLKLMNGASPVIKLFEQAAPEMTNLTLTYAYGTFGRIAYELLSFGEMNILKAPWWIAIFVVLIYYPIILIPAWFLMVVDLLVKNREGNGMLFVFGKKHN